MMELQSSRTESVKEGREGDEGGAGGGQRAGMKRKHEEVDAPTKKLVDHQWL